jgi:hypothetical protein
MAYSADRKPGELTALTSLAVDDVFVVGDTSDASEVAKHITKANLLTDLGATFEPKKGADDNYVTDAEKTALHAAVTVTDSTEIDFTLTGQDITASLKAGSIDETKLDTSVNASLDLADSALQPSVYNAQTVLAATADNTPAALTVGEQTVVGRATGGNIAALAIDSDLSSVSANDDTIPSAKATKSALDAKAPLASPTFTGTVTMPVGLTGVLRADTGVVSVDTDVTDLVSASSDTVAGKIEVATAAETTTGTDAGRAVSPDGLAGSDYGKRHVSFVLNGTTALTTSEKAYWRVPSTMNGWNLVAVSASVGTGAAGSSSSGTPTFTVKNITQSSDAMLSTALTVDANEYTSASAAAAAVIDTAKDDVATDDLIEIAVTTAGTGVTYATVTLTFQLP